MGDVIRNMGLFAMLTILLMFPSVSSVPSGVGVEGNEGCLCHSRMESTTVNLIGLPVEYGANTTYDVQLLINSPVEVVEEQSQGGFRITVSNGTMVFNESEAQFLDNGWTHKNNGTYQRSWNFTWTSPNDNMSRSEFLVYGNAVNGNDGQTGDGWNEYSVVLPGTEYEGDLSKSSSIDGLGMYDKILLAIGLCALVGMLWSAGRS
ncbi:MAG: hypothetical protein HOI79_06650 [Euryarchaeota archaeon]|jgi:hypothetical protein|nr:hypothetical protein [Euryarchaeota archaeon]MBT5661732.1 hypothetical protein [Euryarchaeota archaeon]